MTSGAPLEPVYHLTDPDGRVIGQVWRPVSPELVGRAAGTILLRRPAPSLRRTP